VAREAHDPYDQGLENFPSADDGNGEKNQFWIHRFSS